MRRNMILVLLALLMAGCGGGGGETNGDLGGADRQAGDVVGGDALNKPLPYAIHPPVLKLQAFTLQVTADRSMGLTGQDFTLSARVARGEAAGTLTWTWDRGEGPDESLTGSEVTLSFEQAGSHVVFATAVDENGEQAVGGVLLTVQEAEADYLVGDVNGDGQVSEQDLVRAGEHLTGKPLDSEEFLRGDIDLNGRLQEFDLDLIRMAVEAGAPAPDVLWPSSGSLGTLVRVIHPALLDPEKKIEVQFGDAAPMIPVRAKPGYATTVVPPDVKGTGKIKVKLLAGGETSAEFDFQLLALPAASAEPGARVLDSMDRLEGLVEQMPVLMDSYFQVLGVPAEESEVIQGMLLVAIQSYQEHRAAFEDAFNRMEPEGRAAFEQVALANGLDQVLIQIQDLETQLQDPGFFDNAETSMTLGQAATVMTVLCAAQGIADISSKVAEINEIAAGYLDWFDNWPINKLPIVGQVITFLSSISTAIGAITDVIGIAAEFIPQFGDLQVEVAPTSLMVGNTATCTPSIVVQVASRICGAGANLAINGVMTMMQDALSRRLGSMMPLVSSAFRSAHYNQDNMNWVVALIYDGISSISGAILNTLGVRKLLENLAASACELVDDPHLPLNPQILQASCGSVAAGVWTCTEACIGSVTVTGRQDVCGTPKEGSSGITCTGCNPQTCGAGCCQGQTCLPHAGQSDNLCGTAGAACTACQDNFHCQQGVCTCSSDCSTAGEKKCQNNSVYLCTQVANNPPCLQWKLDEPCINGATCDNGQCTGGCNGTNCQGCCTGDGACLDGTSSDFCGKNGSTCGYCGGPPSVCENGACVCEPQCDGMVCGSDLCGGSCGTCPAGQTCDNGQCKQNCGNGTLDQGEECENNGQCDEGLECKSCKCKEPGGGGGPCDPPAAGLEGEQSHVSVDPADCSCAAGGGYSPDSVLVLDNFASWGTGGSSEPPWTITDTDPPGLSSEGWMLGAFPLGQPITVYLTNPETGDAVAVTFTMTENGITDVSVECL